MILIYVCDGQTKCVIDNETYEMDGQTNMHFDNQTTYMVSISIVVIITINASLIGGVSVLMSSIKNFNERKYKEIFSHPKICTSTMWLIFQ